VKRLVISSSIAALVAGGAGFAFAGQPGPNGHNDYGLCQAYFAGSANGQAHKHQAGPFQALEATADQTVGNKDGTGTADEVAQYCDSVTPGGK
jgi:hypothetical protein